jgi:hypothetical protein
MLIEAKKKNKKVIQLNIFLKIDSCEIKMDAGNFTFFMGDNANIKVVAVSFF